MTKLCIIFKLSKPILRKLILNDFRKFWNFVILAIFTEEKWCDFPLKWTKPNRVKEVSRPNPCIWYCYFSFVRLCFGYPANMWYPERYPQCDFQHNCGCCQNPKMTLFWAIPQSKSKGFFSEASNWRLRLKIARTHQNLQNVQSDCQKNDFFKILKKSNFIDFGKFLV